MVKMHGLAVLLIIFQGIIIQCKGGLNEPGPSNDLFKGIISRMKQEERPPSKDTKEMKNLLKNRIVLLFSPDQYINGQHETCEFCHLDDIFLKFENHETVKLFFAKFGPLVRKFELRYYISPSISIHKEYIEKYRDNFDEIRFSIYNNANIWQEFEYEKFKNVKKFQWWGHVNRVNPFEIEKIFPSVESIKMSGQLKIRNGLPKLKKLKYLNLNGFRNENEHFNNEAAMVLTFKGNQQLEDIILSDIKERKTMEAIASSLERLKTLTIERPGGECISQSSMNKLRLPELQHLGILYPDMAELQTNILLDMPKLKSLKLQSERPALMKLFEPYFNQLETVEVISGAYNPIDLIQNFTKMKELTVRNRGNAYLSFVENVFSMESKLETLRLLGLNQITFQDYKNTMDTINENLVNKNKTKWTLELENWMGKDQENLVFKLDSKRKRSTWKRC